MDNILSKKISVFPNQTSIEVIGGQINTIGSILRKIKDGEWKDQVEKIRDAKDKGVKDDLKRKINTIAFHGIFDGFRKKNKFIESSGIVILDIDDIEDDLEEVKREIMEDSDHVVSCMISPSGNGIKVLYYVHSELITQDSYREIGKKIVSDFDIYGKVDFLSVTDTLIATYDPNILINYDAIPRYVIVKDFKVNKSNLEERDESKKLWDDAQEFFELVLFNDIISKTNNNYHFIQVSILDMAKYGFQHKDHDLEFIIELSESEFGSSNKNETRFKECVEIAKNYPQLKWAYKTSNNEDDVEEIDYSVYMPNDENNDDLEQHNNDGLIDYSNIKDRVLEVAKRGNRIGREVSLSNLANIYRFYGTGICLFTGIPTSGKTEMVDQCVLDLARLYGEETLICGFEQEPEEHLVKLCRKLIGLDVRHKSWLNNKNEPYLNKALDFITSKIKHVNAIEVGSNIDKILEVCARQIKKSRDSGGNPKYVVIDPFNMLSIKGRYSQTEKIEEILKKITLFSHSMKVLVILVAHPTKMTKDEKTGEYEMPGFYNVKGSSAFYEMCYHGLVVHRKRGYVIVKTLKVKQNNQGKKDEEAYFLYNLDSGRYIPIDSSLNELEGDHRDMDWLDKALELDKLNK